MPRFGKIRLMEMPNIYTACAFLQEDRVRIGVGPEREGDPWIIDFPSLDRTHVGISPGGMMSFVPVPGPGDMFVSVMGLFPPFKGLGGGIFRHVRRQGGYEVSKVIDLPFAHRCDILHKNGKNYLFSATVSRFKDAPEDWSEPGEVYCTELSDPDAPAWQADKVIDSLFRNHGMLRIQWDGREVMAVSGAEGIFMLDVRQDGSVCVERLFDGEVSEFGLVDIDDDGQVELATIEPFHGNTLCIYHRDGSVWNRIYESPLSFGHGLSAGILDSQGVVVVGNRRGASDLQLFYRGSRKIEMTCVETGTGTTQSQLFSWAGRDYILAANQLKSEVAAYYLETSLSNL